MGTRAAFFVGDPCDLETRECLGYIAFDGYPEGLPEVLTAKSEAEFRDALEGIREREDFGDPARGFPFPWADDLFVTDYVYAFFDGASRVTCFHSGFVTLSELETSGFPEADQLPTCPAPSAYNPEMPDSIMILSVKEKP